jgi:hypothetical protein
MANEGFERVHPREAMKDSKPTLEDFTLPVASLLQFSLMCSSYSTPDFVI